MTLEAHSRASLAAAIMAMAMISAVFGLATIRAKKIERQAIPEVARQTALADEDTPDPQWLQRSKNQGMAFQQAAFAQPDLLPFYGSSELVKPIPERASVFFLNYPSGFEVFPIGKAGTTSLIILQKIAAVGSAAHGRKMAILLSPGWFFTASTEGRFYEGNFSRQQASATIFNLHLSLALKEATARRMLAHPGTLRTRSLLTFAAQRLAGGGLLDRSLYALTMPLGWLQNTVFSAQDHFEACTNLAMAHLLELPPPPHEPKALLWPELLAQASQAAQRNDRATAPWPSGKAASDASFRETMMQSAEWEDLDLLLQTTQELGVETLLISMPPDGRYFEQQGVSRMTLEVFTQRLRQAVQKHGVQLAAFEDHLEDPTFLLDHHDHLTSKGWMYVNQAIDRFCHEGADRAGR